MIKNNIKFDFDDFTIIPSSDSIINHRSECSVIECGILPIFTAPMDTVVSLDNYKEYINHGITTIMPRLPYNSYSIESVSYDPMLWFSYGLKEFKYIFIDNTIDVMDKKVYALLDIANGHMPLVEEYAITVKEKYGNSIVLMVGNIANPETYRSLSNAGVDFCRCGIGGGNACLSSVQTKIHYPMASLISECYEISCNIKTPAKIVADGGMKKYADVIGALFLGADYVMLGSIFNKALESCGDTYYANKRHEGWLEPGEQVNQYDPKINEYFQNGGKLFKKFRGMSTKDVQKSLGCEIIKTSEGITKMQEVEYTIGGWTENFTHYLKTAMSYTGCRNLNEFREYNGMVFITENALNRFNK